MSSSPLPLTGRNRTAIVDELRRLLPRLESRGGAARVLAFGLDALDRHLPHGGLAAEALHEVVPAAEGDRPAAFGFLAALLGTLPKGGPLVLVMPTRDLVRHGRPYGHGLNRLREPRTCRREQCICRHI